MWKFSGKARERLGYERSRFDPSFRSFIFLLETHSITGQNFSIRARLKNGSDR